MDILPEELLSKIFEELKPRDLLHVSRATKKFARVAAPSLYKRCEFAQYSYAQQRRDKKRFLRTLISRPHLAELVQHISLGDWADELQVAAGEDDENAISPDEAKLIALCVPMLADSPASQPMELCLEQSIQQASSFIIPSMLTNLKSLTINEHMHLHALHPGPPALEVLQELILLSAWPITLDVKRPFQNLTDVHLGASAEYSPAEQYRDCRTIARFIKLPSIQRFTVERFCDFGGIHPWACGDFSSNVKEIVLRHCLLSCSSIRAILRSCRTLEVFECTRVYLPGIDIAIPEWYSDSILPEDIAQHKESLHRLRLDIRSTISDDHRIDLTAEPFGSLAELKSLSYLDIDAEHLVGSTEHLGLTLAETLPVNLEYLILRAHAVRPDYDGQLWLEAARVLLKNKTLQSIEIHHDFSPLTLKPEFIRVVEEDFSTIEFQADESRKMVVRRR